MTLFFFGNLGVPLSCYGVWACCCAAVLGDENEKCEVTAESIVIGGLGWVGLCGSVLFR